MTMDNPPPGRGDTTVLTPPSDGARRRSMDGPSSARRPIRIPPSTAGVMRPMLVLLPVLVFLVPSLFLALVRTPTYTAEARMLVAGFDTNASRNLAGTYARIIDTDVIISAVVKASGLPRGDVAGHISGAAITDSAILRVRGTASSSRQAVALARAAATAVTDYGNELGASGSGDLLTSYQKAVEQQKLADAAVRQVLATPGAPADQVAKAQAADAAATLRTSRAAALFSSTGTGGQVRLVGLALDVSNDRRAKLELALLVPIVLGLVVGIGLATLAVNRPPEDDDVITVR
jgi:capsular polysaccharide biosynthesis protein